MGVWGKRVLMVLFGFEAILFCLVYFFGSYGIHVLFRLKKENNILHKEIISLGKGIIQLEHEIDDWKHNDFVKEKFAREQLFMQKKNEYIFFLKK